MSKEARTQAKVGVGIGVLWKALAQDIRNVVPKVLPNLVTAVDLLEGDGGLGTVLLFRFNNDLPNMSYQKEKLVELDESLHQIALQVIEGGHLNHGFSSYTTVFKLTAITEAETMVDVKVVYDTEAEEGRMPTDTTKATLTFLKCLEDHLLNPGF